MARQSSSRQDGLPFVSVVVPHFDDLVRLERCLEALTAQSYPAERFEVIVADNDTPGAREALERMVGGRARLVVIEERGAGPARNGAVAVARGEVLAFTDSDCLPAADWLANGVKALERSDFVGGAMQVLVNAPAISGAEAFELVFAFDNRTYVERKAFTVTANLLCRTEVFERVGGFRVGVPEDLDWSHRAGAAGYRIGYAADAVVGHPARRDWRELSGKWRRLNREAFAIATADGKGRLRWFAKALALPVSALAHTPRVLASPKLSSWRDRAAALAMLYRLRLWRCADALGLLARGGA